MRYKSGNIGSKFVVTLLLLSSPKSTKTSFQLGLRWGTLGHFHRPHSLLGRGQLEYNPFLIEK